MGRPFFEIQLRIHVSPREGATGIHLETEAFFAPPYFYCGAIIWLLETSWVPPHTQRTPFGFRLALGMLAIRRRPVQVRTSSNFS